MQKNTEIEYRVLLPIDDFEKVLNSLKKEYDLSSHTLRLSFMCFYKNDDKQFDIRVRVTNSKSEMVIKVGALHSDDRLEMSQPIDNVQFTGFVRMLSHLSKDTYIAERETFNLKSADKRMIISVVRATDTAYIEYEFQNDDLNLDDAKNYLLRIIKSHGFTELDKDGFGLLNTQLDKEDWKFTDTDADVKKLESILSSKYFV